jgi:hypothetical protein
VDKTIIIKLTDFVEEESLAAVLSDLSEFYSAEAKRRSPGIRKDQCTQAAQKLAELSRWVEEQDL